MSRRTTYLLTAIVLLAALFFYDRSNRAEEVLPATVLSVTARDPGQGPDQWHVTVQIADQEVTLAPVTARPDLAPGDALCVLRITRTNQPVEHVRASAGTTC